MRSFAQGKVSGVGIRNIPVNENILDGVALSEMEEKSPKTYLFRRSVG
jgi:hypothetical protein